ncbi:MAG: hypothetical protein RIT27_2467 [Pseudomonadota bacterium]|jgi:hypothetical protein
MSQTTFPPFFSAELLSTQQRFWENCFKINPQQPAMPDVLSLWNGALDNMRKQMSGWIESPLQQVTAETQQFSTLVEQFQSYMQQFPNWQTQFQTHAQLWQTHQQAQQKALQMIQQIGMRTVHLLNQRVSELSAQQPLPPQALYTAWVEAGEKAYAEFVSTDDYAKTTGELINSWLAWRQNGRLALDEMLASLHLPTYAQTQQLQVKLADLRAQQQQAQQIDNSEEIASLNAEINRLQAIITELQTVKETAEETTKEMAKEVAIVETSVEITESVQTAVESIEEKTEETSVVEMQSPEPDVEIPKKAPAKKTTKKASSSRSATAFKSR